MSGSQTAAVAPQTVEILPDREWFPDRLRSCDVSPSFWICESSGLEGLAPDPSTVNCQTEKKLVHIWCYNNNLTRKNCKSEILSIGNWEEGR